MGKFENPRYIQDAIERGNHDELSRMAKESVKSRAVNKDIKSELKKISEEKAFEELLESRREQNLDSNPID